MRHINLIHRRFVILITLFAICIVSCTPTDSVIPTNSYITEHKIPTRTYKPQVIKTSTTTPGYTKTVVPMNSPTSTKKPITPIVLPTLSVDESKSLILSLLNDNGNCRLPCLWGQTPGNTVAQTLSRFVQQFGNRDKPQDIFTVVDNDTDWGSITISLWKGFSTPTIGFDYYITDDVLVLTKLYSGVTLEKGEGANVTSSPAFGDEFYMELLDYYLLRSILDNYGLPTEVLVHPYPDDPMYPTDYTIPFSLVLVYKNFFVEYILPREKQGELFVACPSKTNSLYLFSWDPKTKPTLLDIAKWKSGDGLNELNLDYYKSLEEATGMSIEEFYQKFKDPNHTECLKSPVDLWHP